MRNAPSLRGFALCAVSVLMGASAYAADRGSLSEAQKNYQKERAACLNGTSHQDRATCLKEAANALADARRGRLAGSGADLQANATQRCKALPEQDRADCVARVSGQGTQAGSVEGGGIYRETVTRSVETPGSGTVSGSGTSSGSGN